MLRRIGGFFSFGVLAQVVGIATGIAQAHMLGPAGKSVLAYAAVALGLVLTATDGLTAAVLSQAARQPPALVHVALRRVVTVLTLPVCAIALVAGALVPSQRPLLGVALAAPFALYVQGTRGLLFAAGRTRALIVQGALPTVVFGLVVIPLLLLHLPAYGALAVWVAAYAAAAAYGALRVRAPAAQYTGADVNSTARTQLRTATANGAALLSGYVNLRIDVFLVSAVLGARELGIYTLAIMSAELLWTVSQPVLYSVMDRIAGAPLDEARALVARLVRNTLAVEVVLGLLLALVAPALIGLVYGGRFAPSGELVRLLVPGAVAYSAEAIVGYFILVRMERPMLLLVTQAVSAFACAAITLAGFRTLGLAGAAIATSVTYVGVVTFLVAWFCRHAQIDPRTLLIVRVEDLRWYRERLRRTLRRPRTELPLPPGELGDALEHGRG